MAEARDPNRLDRAVVGVISGGLLAVIWSGVWQAALRTGRDQAATWKLTTSGALLAGGLAAVVCGLVYQWRRKRPPTTPPVAGPRQPGSASQPASGTRRGREPTRLA